MDYSDEFLVIQQQFCAALNPFQNKTFGGKVDLVQIPYASAFNPYTCYVEKYLTKPVPVLFLGLNAARNGMCTTGIPFGDIDFVLNYLDVTGTVQRMDPRTGMVDEKNLTHLTDLKKEESGSRFWGFIEQLCEDPEQFFENCFVYTYCPLAFSCKNDDVSLPKLRPSQRRPLESVCDDYLAQAMRYLQTSIVVAIGNYAEEKAKAVRDKPENKDLRGIEIIKIRHPSPQDKMNEEQWRTHTQGIIKNTTSLQPYFESQN